MSDAMCLSLADDFGRFGLGVAGSAFGGEAQPHPGAALAGLLLRRIAQLDPAAVLFEDAADDGEAEAGALLAGRHVGLEQPVAVFLRQADAVVDHVDDDIVAVARRDHPDAAAAALGGGHGGDRLGGVLDDVGERLRDQPAVEARRHRVLGQLQLDVDVGIADAHQEDHLAHGVGDVLGRDHPRPGRPPAAPSRDALRGAAGPHRAPRRGRDQRRRAPSAGAGARHRGDAHRARRGAPARPLARLRRRPSGRPAASAGSRRPRRLHRASILQVPGDEPAEQRPPEPRGPPRQHVGRVVDAQTDPRDADEERQAERDRDDVDPDAPPGGEPGQQGAEGEVDDGGRHGMPAGKAQTLDGDQVRHDVGTASGEDLLQGHAQETTPGGGDEHERCRAVSMQQREVADRAEQDGRQDRGAAEGREVRDRLREPPGTDQQRGIVRAADEPEYPLVELAHLAFTHLLRKLDEAVDGEDDHEGGEQDDGFLTREPAQRKTSRVAERSKQAADTGRRAAWRSCLARFDEGRVSGHAGLGLLVDGGPESRFPAPAPPREYAPLGPREEAAGRARHQRAAQDSLARVAGGVRPLIVRLLVDHDSAAIGVEDRGRARAERQSVGDRHVLRPAARVGLEVGQVAAVGALGILEAVLLPQGVEVTARTLERGRLALADRVHVDAMATGCQPTGLHHDPDPPVLLPEHRRADGFPARVPQLGPCHPRAARSPPIARWRSRW